MRTSRRGNPILDNRIDELPSSYETQSRKVLSMGNFVYKASNYATTAFLKYRSFIRDVS